VSATRKQRKQHSVNERVAILCEKLKTAEDPVEVEELITELQTELRECMLNLRNKLMSLPDDSRMAS
jgi:hypothetical protein